jgi:hypothetical protein
MIEICAAHLALMRYQASLVPVCFAKASYVDIRRINRLPNSINEGLKDFSCMILWQNCLVQTKLPQGADCVNGEANSNLPNVLYSYSTMQHGAIENLYKEAGSQWLRIVLSSAP